jgi:hypothetical protein
MSTANNLAVFTCPLFRNPGSLRAIPELYRDKL